MFTHRVLVVDDPQTLNHSQIVTLLEAAGGAAEILTEAMKTEGGEAFPAAAYLVVPDAAQPSTWKLRIWESPTAKVTKAQLGRAAAALGKGFRGRTVQLSPDQRAAALRKLRTLYKTAGVTGDELPPVLQAAAYTVATRRLRRSARHLLEAGAVPEAMRPELLEDLETLREASYYGQMLAAMQEGVLSFETIICAAQAALQEWHESCHGPYGGTHPYDCSVRVVATFPDAVVYEMQGKLYQDGYRIDGTTVLLAGTAEEVTAEFTKVRGEGGPLTEVRIQPGGGAPPAAVAPPAGAPAVTHQEALALLAEQKPAGILREGQIDREQRVIRNTVLLNATSANGEHGRRIYTEAALQQAARLSEGLPAYANHTTKELAFKPRAVQELIGRHRNVRYDAPRARVLSDLHILEHQAPWVFALAEDLGDQVGNSLVSRGRVRLQDGIEYVDEIVQVRSGDLVSDPATTKGLFEHRSAWDATHAAPAGPITSQGEPMDLKTITEALDKDELMAERIKQRVAAKELKELGEAQAALATAATEKAALEGQLKTASTALAESKTKLDTFESEKAVGAKRGRLDTVLAEHALGKKYGKTVGAITDVFRGALMEADEAKWTGLMDDRLASLDAAAGTRTGQPAESQRKADGALQEHRDGGVKLPTGICAEMSAALR